MKPPEYPRSARQTSSKRLAGLQAMESSFHLLRQLPPSAFAVYTVGVIPLLIGWFFFLEALGRSANALRLLAPAALLLAVLQMWFHFWQAVFCRTVRESIGMELPQPWTFRRILTLALMQGALQPWAILLIPIASVLFFPFGYVHAFFQFSTVLADGEISLRRLIRRAWAISKSEHRTHLVTIWMSSPWLLLGNAALVAIMVALVRWSAGMSGTSVVLVVLLSIAIAVLFWMTPFSMALWLNAGVLFIQIPILFRMFLGVDLMAGQHPETMINPLTITVVTGIVAAFLDMNTKVASTLQVFTGEARHTGADLRLQVRQAREARGLGGVISGLLLLCMVVPAFHGQTRGSFSNETQALFLRINRQKPVAAEDEHQSEKRSTAPTAAHLDDCIRREASSDRYRWHRPEGTLHLQGDSSLMEKWVREIGDAIRKLKEWLFGKGPRATDSKTGKTKHDGFWYYGILALIVAISLGLIVRAVIRYRKRRRVGQKLTEVSAIPRLEIAIDDEATLASDLPEDEWTRMTRELMASGDYRLAARAAYFSILAHLASRQLILIQPSRTEREYERDICRRSHAEPQVARTFSIAVTLFETIWYGLYPVSESTVTTLMDYRERMARHAGV